MDDDARLLSLLWDRYVEDVPAARAFVATTGGAFANDHVALRSLARPGSGIAMFADVFERLGWRRAGAYDFKDAALSAIHLSKDGAPRIFVSELHADRLPDVAQRALAALPPDPPAPRDDVEALARWFAPPTAPTAQALRDVEAHSQYGAWLLCFGRKVNHFTAAVDDVLAWSARMTALGIAMKDEIEGAPGGPLVQTATHAAPANVVLADGSVVVRPYAYLEIAARQEGFDGFLAPQARRLFDMTAT